MELLRLSILAIALHVQLHTGVLSSSEDMDIWSQKNWKSDPKESGFTLHFDDQLKHSKSERFHGLMGRSLEMSQPLQPGQKRYNGERFVGLMGKRCSQGYFEATPDKQQY